MPQLLLNNRTHKVLKTIVQLYMPAIATFYFTVGSIWGWPHIEAVIGTITAITTLLGVVLGITGHNYDKTAVPIKATPDGVLNVTRQDDNKILYDFDAKESMTDLRNRTSVVFRINNEL